MRRTILKILIGISLAVLVGYIVVLYMPKATVKTKSVDVTISAGDIYADYMADEAAANEKYLGKVIAIDGLIDEKYQDENDAPIVILMNEAGDIVALVTLESSQLSKWETYNEGDPIKIKAMCNGMLMEVALSKGVIVE